MQDFCLLDRRRVFPTPSLPKRTSPTSPVQSATSHKCTIKVTPQASGQPFSHYSLYPICSSNWHLTQPLLIPALDFHQGWGLPQPRLLWLSSGLTSLKAPVDYPEQIPPQANSMFNPHHFGNCLHRAQQAVPSCGYTIPAHCSKATWTPQPTHRLLPSDILDPLCSFSTGCS